jgi:uncharacterized protein (DUF2267 family)
MDNTTTPMQDANFHSSRRAGKEIHTCVKTHDRKTGRIDQALDEAQRWVAETAEHLGAYPGERAPEALRAVLLSLRDSLPFEQAVKLANHLPALIRGAYYEGWNPAPDPHAGVLVRIAERLADVDARSAADAVFKTLRTFNEANLPALTEGWPALVREVVIVRHDEEPASAPATIDKKTTEIKVAMDRAEMDGAPQEKLPEILADLTAVKKSTAAADWGVHDLNLWLQHLQEMTGWPDRTRAFAALNAVLQALRDRLPLAQALRVGLHLPAAIRGFYFENWQAEPRPSEERTLEDFRTEVQELLAGSFAINPDEAARAVFRLLSGAQQGVPQPIRRLFPTKSRGPQVRRTSSSTRGKRVPK